MICPNTEAGLYSRGKWEGGIGEGGEDSLTDDKRNFFQTTSEQVF